MALSFRFLFLLTIIPIVQAAHQRVYLSSNSGAEGEGIYLSDLNMDTGELSAVRLAGEVRYPSFFVIHPTGNRLYSTTKFEDEKGSQVDGVAAYKIGEDGELTLINERSAIGRGPCHVSLDRTGKILMVANYGDGIVASYPLTDDGSIGSVASWFRHEGSGVNKARQASAHAHSINIDLSNRRAYAADLGADKIFIYTLDAASGILTENEIPSFATPAGGGVRHLTFHPSGRYAYANLELSSEVIALEIDVDTGGMDLIETLSTLPVGSDFESNSTAETLLHPNGRFLYVSNRNHDSIAIFSIDQDTGRITTIGNESTRGLFPRNFGIDPTGTFLIVANQKSDDVFSFRIDATTGLLDWTGSSIALKSPFCVRF